MTFRALLLIAVGVALAAGPAAAQTNPYTWNTTTGTWNVAGNWLNGTSAAEVPPSTADTQLVFAAGGTTGYTTTNNIGAFTLNRLTANNTGTGTITVAGPAANPLTFAGTTPTLDITGNVLFTGLFAGAPTITKVGPGTFIHDSNNSGFTGTLVVNGGTFVNRDNGNVNTNFNPVSIVVNSGGTYQFGAAGVGNPNLPTSTYITINPGGVVNWQEGEQFGGIDLAGGTLTLNGGNAGGTDGGRAQVWQSGTVNGTANSVGGSAVINKTTTGTVTVTGGASVTSTINLQNGTMAFVNPANLGASNIALGSTDGGTGGTFEYQGPTATRAGGTFTANAGGGTVRVTQATADLALAGNLGGAGPLTKAGPGTLTVGGVLLQTGLTTVAEGTLRLNPVASAGGVGVSAGATLAVNAGTGAASLALPTLATAGTVRFDLDTASVPAAALVAVGNADGLTAGGTLSVTNQQAFASGSYQLIDYTGTGITSGFALTLPGRTAGTLVYNTTDTRIDLSITGTDSVRWTGAVNATWDKGTAPGAGGTNNWQLVTAGTATNFVDTDTVTFDDTATAFTVDLGLTVNPSGVTVTNSAANPYTIQGAGKIGGTTGLTKAGAGTLRLATDNDYTGPTAVTGGTLQLGTGGTAGGVAGPITLAAGTSLVVDRSNASALPGTITPSDGASVLNAGTGAVTVAGTVPLAAANVTVGGAGDILFGAPISGTGTLTKTGAGTAFLLANNNPFTGTLVIDGGRVILQDVAGGDLSATSIVVNSGGAFQFGVAAGENPDLPDATYITINAGGTVEWRVGEQFGGINLLGGTLVLNGGNAGGLVGTVAQDWRSGTVNGITANGPSGSNPINKTTTGTVNVIGLATIGNVLNVQEGTVAFAAAANLGTAALNLGAASTGGTVEYQGATATRGGAVGVNAGGGTVAVTTAGSVLTLSGVVGGTGPLTKTGPGVLALTGANTYAGGTTVAAGTLRAGNATNSTGGGAVDVNAGGTLDGAGAVGGNVALNAGGTVQAGVGTPTGTLTVGGTLTASGTNTLRVAVADGALGNGTADPTAGLVAVTGPFVSNTGGLTSIKLVGSEATFDLGLTYTVTVATFASSPELSLANFTIDPNPEGFAYAGTPTLALTATQLQITFAPVPEPATVLGLAAGVVAVGGWVRWRRAG